MRCWPATSPWRKDRSRLQPIHFLNPKFACSLERERVLNCSGNLERDRAGGFGKPNDFDSSAGNQSERNDQAQEIRVFFADPAQADLFVFANIKHGAGGKVWKFSLERRDRIAVRIVGRMAQEFGDSRLEFFADVMLEFFGLAVNVLEGVAEGLVQVGFEQPMVADQFERDASPGRGQTGTVVRFVFDQTQFGQAFEHFGDTAGFDLEPVGEGLRVDAICTERVNRL